MADAESDNDYVPRSSPPDTKVVTSIQDAQDAEADTYMTRPNRYFGPDSTWLTWTEQDRLAAQSLDQIRSQNLSLHLLNAHTLKRKAEAELSRDKRSRKGKRRASSVASGIEQDGSSLQLPRRWTAWPLPPEDVPRDVDEAAISGSIGHRPITDAFPSARLEECLIGISTKIARARWRSRAWATPETKDTPEPTDTTIKTEDRNETRKPGLKRVQDPELSDAAETLSSGSDSDSDDGPKAVYSQTFIAEEEEPEAQTKTTEELSELESEDEAEEEPPTPIADDEQARNVLLPSTRHTLSKLDDLLTGLHKARRAYASSRRRGRRDSEASDAGADRMQSSRSRGRSRSRARRNRRSVSRTSDVSNSPKHTDVSEASRQNLGLRDWSDVVGMAYLTDWDPAVVRRASERCAMLLGENMIFRTFQEGAKGKSSHSEHYAVEPVDTVSEDDAEIESANGVRTTIACELCRVNRRKCEPANAEASNGPCKRCVENGDECTGVGVNPISQPARCPFRFCERHHIAFRKQWHLQRHIEEVHSDERAPMSSSPARSSASEGYLASTALPVCPVASCSRHERPFSEGGKLYRHLRNMHPDVDVDEVKKLEVQRRGERRGRWRNESRRKQLAKKNRSRSLGVPSSPPPLVGSIHGADEGE